MLVPQGVTNRVMCLFGLWTLYEVAKEDDEQAGAVLWSEWQYPEES